MTIGNNPTGLDSSYISLPIPGPNSDDYSAVVIGADGKPLGESTGNATVTGYSTQDEISSYLDSLTPSQFLDVTKSIMSKYGSTTDAMQTFLDTLDPSNPDIPPDVMMYLIQIDVAMLSSGNIQMVSISNLSASQLDELGITEEGYTAAAASANEERAAAETGQASGVPQPSSWFSGNVYTQFLIAFMEMAKTMMQSKSAQTTIEVAAMNIITEMAEHQADLIMETAKLNQIQHIATAVMAGVSIAITVGAAAAAMKPSGVKDPKTGEQMYQQRTDTDGTKTDVIGKDGNPVKLTGPSSHYQLFMNLSTMGSQLEKFVTSTIQAAQDITIAEKEGYQKILEAYRSIIQTQMTKAAEVFKTQSDAVDQWINTLQQMLDKLDEAIKKGL